MSRAYDRKERRRYSDDSDSEDDSRFERMYCRMKKMMLRDPELMVTGAEAYADVFNTVAQTLPIGGKVTFEFNDTLSHVEHVPSSGDILIKKSGIYLIISSLNLNDPSQWTLFINDVPHASSTVGTNIAASELTLGHIKALNAGDIVSLRNYMSPKDTSLSVNAGGDGTVGSTNAEMVLIRIAPYGGSRHCLK